LFRQRLDAAFAAFGLEAESHCVILPRLDPNRYAAAASCCDLALDSIGWSGCNSSLESLAHDLPFVTLPGELMRGRHTAAILEMMGVTETIATSLDAYLEIAVRLGRDKEWRMELRRRVLQNKHRVYNDRACIAALEDFLEEQARSIRPE
jgi:predicted O-linked N-acetylglucosamine transferase (SPINDLY family)